MQKKFIDRSGGKGITVFRRKFLSHSAEKFVGEHIGVSENFGNRKTLCIRRGYHYFALKIFCLSTRKIRRRAFCVSKKLSSKNLMLRRRGVITIFRRKFFVS